ncbi:hypothetical protein LV779_36900 [Streptomyces thinghirensis]|nr:hypothetical protein [Streptomyces thinghirensis]
MRDLLVLAGEGPGAAAGRRPVPLVDVLRAATSEVEAGCERIELSLLADHRGRRARGTASCTMRRRAAGEREPRSPPRRTKVKVTGHALPDGRVLIEIHDTGIGLSPEDLAAISEAARLAADRGRLRLPPHGSVRGRPPLPQRHGIRASSCARPTPVVRPRAGACCPFDVAQGGRKPCNPSRISPPRARRRSGRRAGAASVAAASVVAAGAVAPSVAAVTFGWRWRCPRRRCAEGGGQLGAGQGRRAAHCPGAGTRAVVRVRRAARRPQSRRDQTSRTARLRPARVPGAGAGAGHRGTPAGPEPRPRALNPPSLLAACRRAQHPAAGSGRASADAARPRPRSAGKRRGRNGDAEQGRLAAAACRGDPRAAELPGGRPAAPYPSWAPRTRSRPCRAPRWTPRAATRSRTARVRDRTPRFDDRRARARPPRCRRFPARRVPEPRRHGRVRPARSEPGTVRTSTARTSTVRTSTARAERTQPRRTTSSRGPSRPSKNGGSFVRPDVFGGQPGTGPDRPGLDRPVQRRPGLRQRLDRAAPPAERQEPGPHRPVRAPAGQRRARRERLRRPAAAGPAASGPPEPAGGDTNGTAAQRRVTDGPCPCLRPR